MTYTMLPLKGHPASFPRLPICSLPNNTWVGWETLKYIGTHVRSHDDGDDDDDVDDDDDGGDVVQADMLDGHFLCETSSNDAVIAKPRVFRRTGIRTQFCIVSCQDIHRLSSAEIFHLYC